jgi:UDP-glucose 4-epimerase
MNVIGTLNILAGCAGQGSPVRRFILKSSGHVYGSRPDMHANIREDSRLDANSRHDFVRDIVEVESYVSDFAVRNPDITILTLRFANSLDPQDPSPLARYLDLEVVPTVYGNDPPLQLIHRDDCVEAMLLATKRGPAGAYNIAPPGAVPLSNLLSAAGKLHAPLLPPVALGLAAFAIRQAGIVFLTSQLLDLLRWGRSLSTTKAARSLGFHAARSTEEAFIEFIQERRVLRYEPDRHTYQYEKELEDFIHSRQTGEAAASANGEGEAEALAEPAKSQRPRRHRSRSLPR